jgi:hypothetical protein
MNGNGKELAEAVSETAESWGFWIPYQGGELEAGPSAGAPGLSLIMQKTQIFRLFRRSGLAQDQKIDFGITDSLR